MPKLAYPMPTFRLDFNAMIAPDVFAFSVEDYQEDHKENRIELVEGLSVCVFDDDEDETGKPCRLFAEGVLERNTAQDWSAFARWCVRLTSPFRHVYD